MSLFCSKRADWDGNNTSPQKEPDLELSPLKFASLLQATYGTSLCTLAKDLIYNPKIAVDQPMGSKVIYTIVKLLFDKGYCVYTVYG